MLTAAITGAGDTVEKNENVPVTPQEIADSALRAAKAGATVAHLHVRDPKTGGISHDMGLFREAVRLIRESDQDVIINLTSGVGGDFIPDMAGPFRQAVSLSHESGQPVSIHLTSGGGGDFCPDMADPYQAGKGSDIQTPDERHEPVGALLPEMCTLDCGSVNFGDAVYLSPSDW